MGNKYLKCLTFLIQTSFAQGKIKNKEDIMSRGRSSCTRQRQRVRENNVRKSIKHAQIVCIFMRHQRNNCAIAKDLEDSSA